MNIVYSIFGIIIVSSSSNSSSSGNYSDRGRGSGEQQWSL